MPGTNVEDRRFEFFLKQLERAHALNALVDQHRFEVLKVAFGFHAIVTSAVVFANASPRRSAPLFASAVSAAVALIGVALMGLFFSQHIYMRSYKAWIATLEGRLLDECALIDGSRETVPKSRGTLYHDAYTAYVPAERTLVLMLASLVALNTGVPAGVAYQLGDSVSRCGVIAMVALVLQAAVIALLLRRRDQRPALKLVTGGITVATVTTVAQGNARDVAPHHRGWFVGSFIDSATDLERSEAVEVKWGVHPQGDEREQWSENNATTLVILMRGAFIVEFREEDAVLEREGDYVIFGPGVAHRWRALHDSLVITVRWPSSAQ